MAHLRDDPELVAVQANLDQIGAGLRDTMAQIRRSRAMSQEVSAQALNSFAGAMAAMVECHAEVAAMQAENQIRASKGLSMAYGEDSFRTAAQNMLDTVRREREWIL